MRYRVLAVCFLLSCTSCDDAKDREIASLKSQLAEANRRLSLSAVQGTPQPTLAPARKPPSEPSSASVSPRMPPDFLPADRDKVMALMQAFISNAPNEQVGRRGFDGFLNLVRNYRYGLEGAMRAKGQLKKGEYLFDEKTGLWDPARLAAAAEFAPDYLRRFYGAKTQAGAIEKVGRLMFGGDYAAAAVFMGIKPGDVAKQQAASRAGVAE